MFILLIGNTAADPPLGSERKCSSDRLADQSGGNKDVMR
jgi:hypothetical protein